VTFLVEATTLWLFESRGGIHRLVRISPFDAIRGATLIRLVFVYPESGRRYQIEINEADLRVDTYRSSGAGGQHVNKTDSACGAYHLPTNIVVACKTSAHRHKNRRWR